MKKLIQFLAVAIFFSLLSFSSKPGLINSNSNHRLRPETLDPSVYRLYIDNSKVGQGGKTDFQKLIDAIGDHDVKLVFQFYYNQGYLTLMAYPGPKHHDTNFKWDMRIKLEVCKGCPLVRNIDNHLTSLGDMEVEDEDSNITELQTLANNTKYIVLIPELKTDKDNITTINYKIAKSQAKDTATICNLSKSEFVTGLNINPSPPRKGN